MRNVYLAVKVVLLALLMAGCSGSDEGGFGPPDDAKAIEDNNRTVGLMGRFEYAEAQAGFLKLAEDWPEWHDVRLNLAIATLNTQAPGSEAEALALAEEVIRADPKNLRAHYVAGLVQLFLGLPDQARAHFEVVADSDAEDAHAAYYLGQCFAQLGDYEQAIAWYQHAMQLDSYLRSAYYGAFQAMQRLSRPEEARALAADYQRLENNPRSYLAEFKYTRMGPKGAALTVDLDSPPPKPRPEGEPFAKAEPVEIENRASIAWRSAAKRPVSLTSVDLQGDGFHDLFLTGVVDLATEGDSTTAGNLVLVGTANRDFRALRDHPLASVTNVNAALWGDFDNDGLVDVYLCRRGPNQLWRQVEDGRWLDVTAATQTSGDDLDTVDGAFFDADHDGDLDLFLVNANGPNELLNNNLDGTFRALAADYGLTGDGGASRLVIPADLDNDRDADLIVINASAPHEVYVNDRLWSYRAATGYDEFKRRPALATLAADIDADGTTELYSVDPDGQLLQWQMDSNGDVRPVELDAPATVLRKMLWAQLGSYDVDGDGRLDLIASSDRGWSVIAVDGDSATTIYEAVSAPGSPQLASLPFVGSSTSGPSMLVVSASGQGLSFWPPGPGRDPFLTLTVSGKQDAAQSMRSNASGIGAELAVRTGSRWTLLHNYRNHTGPGQSLQPLAVGLGGAKRADFVAIDWSDGVFQSEIDMESGQVNAITETQRQLSSCPVLFAWNGEEHVFVSDILGVGGIGYAVGPGEYTTPRPHENFLLPEGLLQPREGHYEIKIGEPMEENAYIDAVRLAIYDLPPDWQMFVDERMGIAGPQPTGAAHFFREERLPRRAFNDRGDEVLRSVVASDGVAAPVGKLDPRFIGRLQEEHVLTLEFAEPLDNGPGTAFLLVDGWVEYPYSQTNFAAWQAGAAYEAPTLEAFSDGKWLTLMPQFGYPAGMPRRMAAPITNLPSGTTRLRLRTNQQIYWDRVAVAYSEPLDVHRKQVVQPAGATLRKTGFAARTTLDQFRPDYDYSNSKPFWDTRYMSGFYTRLGEVLELVNSVDDAVTIIGPGEELHLDFEAVQPQADGWRRYFVVESNGWAKDMDLFTRDGDTVGPLPDSGRPADRRDELHERYNTRFQSGY